MLRPGFTLLEAMMAMAVLAILVLGVCDAVSESYAQGEVSHSNSVGVLLARQLIDEAVSKQMQDPTQPLGPETGMTQRSQYGYVTNYNGYADTSDSVPQLEGGTVDTTNTDTFQRSVSVTVGVQPSIEPANSTHLSDFALVQVTVTDPEGHSVVVPEFVANYPISR